ncbi:MAG: ABC transporter ATP-binding protein [Anaerolineales bacterium]|nr:ABC transporter ATP-binding protein [Anaerolineales bacterium]
MEINIKHLNHTFNHQAEPIRTLEDISFHIESGTFTAIVGPSGCGKSTLLRLLAGLLQPTCGSILIDSALPEQIAANKQISWMAQSPALLPWFTVYKNIELARQINPQNHNGSTARSLLEMMDLQDFAEAYPHQLSGGMQQRAALARTLSLAPRLWLMDEPFASLDALTREELGRDVLRLWSEYRPTVVWVTHNIHEAVLLADQVVVLSRRPARILNQFEITLQRPRTELQPGYQTAVQKIRSALGIPA